MSHRQNCHWVVEHDPSGQFSGLFQIADLRYTAALGHWPVGIRFRNVKDGRVAVFQHGQLATTSGRVIARVGVPPTNPRGLK